MNSLLDTDDFKVALEMSDDAVTTMFAARSLCDISLDDAMDTVNRAVSEDPTVTFKQRVAVQAITQYRLVRELINHYNSMEVTPPSLWERAISKVRTLFGGEQS